LTKEKKKRREKGRWAKGGTGRALSTERRRDLGRVVERKRKRKGKKKKISIGGGEDNQKKGKKQ